MAKKARQLKLYKIRRKLDGKFSLGGAIPRFSIDGKIWKKIGDIKSHLSIVNGYHFDTLKLHPNNNTLDNHPYVRCEIVEYDMIETHKELIINNEFKRTYIINTLDDEIK